MTREARKWIKIAKGYVGDSRNLRTDLKDGIIKALDKIHDAVKTGVDGERTKEGKGEQREIQAKSLNESKIEEILKRRGALLERHTEELKTLPITLEKTMERKGRDEKLLDELEEIKTTTKNMGEKVKELKQPLTHASSQSLPPAIQANTAGPSYAQHY